MKAWILAAALLAEAGAFDLIGVDTLAAVGDPSSPEIRTWGRMGEYHGKLLLMGVPFNRNRPGHRDAFVEISLSDTGFRISSLPRRDIPTRSATVLKPWPGGYGMIAHNHVPLDSGQFKDSGTYLLDMTSLDDIRLVGKIEASWEQAGHQWMDSTFLQVNWKDSGRYLFKEFNRAGEMLWSAEHRFQKQVFSSDTGGRIESFNFVEAKKYPDGGTVLVGYFGAIKTAGLVKLKPDGALEFIRYFDWSPIKSYQYLTDAYFSVQVTGRKDILCFGVNGSNLVMHLYAGNGDSIHVATVPVYNPLSVKSFVYDSRYHVSVRKDWHAFEDFIIDDNLRIIHRDTLDISGFDQSDIGGMSEAVVGKTLFRLVISGYTDRNHFSLWKKRLPDLAPVSASPPRKQRVPHRKPMARNVLGRILAPGRASAK